MMYRVLWTHNDVQNGGYYVDVDAPDAAIATWQVATSVPRGEDNMPPVLVSVTDLNPPAPEG